MLRTGWKSGRKNRIWSVRGEYAPVNTLCHFPDESIWQIMIEQKEGMRIQLKANVENEKTRCKLVVVTR
jgi:hypothetical protein